MILYNLLRRFVVSQLRSGKSESEVRASVDALVDFVFEVVREEELKEIEIA